MLCCHHLGTVYLYQLANNMASREIHKTFFDLYRRDTFLKRLKLTFCKQPPYMTIIVICLLGYSINIMYIIILYRKCWG